MAGLPRFLIAVAITAVRKARQTFCILPGAMTNYCSPYRLSKPNRNCVPDLAILIRNRSADFPFIWKLLDPFVLFNR